MTRVLSLICFIGLLASGVSVAGPYGMAGCGLGSILPKNNDVSQIFAATTNGTSNNQTFGLSSGTSNCTSAGAMVVTIKQEHFIKQNLNSL